MVLAVAASATTSPPNPKTARKLATAVAGTGLGCEDLTQVPNAPNTLDTLSPQSLGFPDGDWGYCTILGERSFLAVFKNAPDTRTYLSVFEDWCPAFVDPIKRARFVVGSNWHIEVEKPRTQRALAKALHAKVRTIRCTT